MVYEGNLTHWVMDTSKVPQSQDVYFKVAATNMLGQGPFSSNSSAFNYIGKKFLDIGNKFLDHLLDHFLNIIFSTLI